MNRELHNLFNLIDAEIRGVQKKANSICSPFNVASCLAMLADGASGKTREELVKFFNFAAPAAADFKLSLQGNVLNTFNSILDSKSLLAQTVKTAQAVFASKSVLDSFNKTCQDNYHAMIRQIDASNTSALTNEINKFVNDKTEGKITSIVNPGDLNSSVVAVLLAVLYFKGKWKKPFEVKNTTKQDFKVNDSTRKKVDMMFSKQKGVAFLEEDGKITVSIPYEGDEISFVIEMAQQGYALPTSVVKDVTYVAQIPAVQDVNISLPKFKVESQLEMNNLFKAAGVATMFDPSACAKDFVGTMTSESVYISKIVHKAMVEVDEEGTVAAAATMAVASRCAAPQPKNFVFDRPFLFHIVDRKNGTVLFSGAVTDPSA